MLFFFTLNLIQIQGYSATAAGASLLPFVVIMFTLSRWSGGLIDRFGARLPLDHRPDHCCGGFCAIRVAYSQWKLLDQFLSGSCRAWTRDGDHCGAINDHRDECCW